MVVMLIGIVLSVAVLSAGGGREQKVEEEARRLVALFTLAQEEAVLTRRELAARIRPDGYEFEVREGDRWLPLQNVAALRPRRFPEEMTVRLLQDDLPVPLDDAENVARILFTSAGESVDFVLELGWAFEDFTYRITGDATGALTIERDGGPGA